jgi:hypothetical protein
MATYVTSLGCLETDRPETGRPSKIVDRRVRMYGRRFAMMAIANLQYFWTLFVKATPVNLPARLTVSPITFAELIS